MLETRWRSPTLLILAALLAPTLVPTPETGTAALAAFS
jgi:hypothetical protein